MLFDVAGGVTGMKTWCRVVFMFFLVFPESAGHTGNIAVGTRRQPYRGIPSRSIL